MMTTGPELHEEHALADGTHVVLRHIRPDDAAQLKRGFEHLSPSSRYRRFLGVVNNLSDAQLEYLTRVDGHDHVAIVATTRDPQGDEVGLGVARFIRASDEPSAAEAAITVADDAQGKGIGRLLALTLGRAARERGVVRFRGEILADNPAVRQLLADVGAVLRHERDGSVAFEVDLGSEDPSGARYDDVVRRLLRAASTYVMDMIKRAT